MITRRGFVGALLGLPLIKHLPLPAAARAPVSIAEINAITMQACMPAILDNYFRATPLLDYLRGERLVTPRETQAALPGVDWDLVDAEEEER